MWTLPKPTTSWRGGCTTTQRDGFDTFYLAVADVDLSGLTIVSRSGNTNLLFKYSVYDNRKIWGRLKLKCCTPTTRKTYIHLNKRIWNICQKEYIFIIKFIINIQKHNSTECRALFWIYLHQTLQGQKIGR